MFLTEKGKRRMALPEKERHMEVLRDLARGMSEPMNEDDVAAIRWAIAQLEKE